MSRQLTPKSNLDTLKKEAKRWLKALRANDLEAHTRLQRAHPQAPAEPGLRHIQHALAQEYGLADWAELKDKLSEYALANRSHAERVAEFMENAVLTYGIPPGTADWDRRYADDPARRLLATRILRKYPEVGRDSVHTAVLCGDTLAIERLLSERPEAASEKGGIRRWEPLLYLCYGRLPITAASENAAIARMLLNAGADPNVYFTDGENHFTPLTGVLGEGEQSPAAVPPHPHAEALALLLLERAADPYDRQGLYNTSLWLDDDRWLDRLWTHAAKSVPAPVWMLAGKRAFDFLLDIAVSRNHLKRAEWLLKHGANPNAIGHYSKRSLHKHAVLLGLTAMAALLVRFGAEPARLEGLEAFQAACMRLDRQAAHGLLELHPEYLEAPGPMMAAAQHDLRDVAALLLDLGMSPNVDDHGQRPLHEAASGDSPSVATLLIEHGAEIDAREPKFGGTPLGWARHQERPRMVELLSPVSRDVFTLAATGNVERLRQVLTAEPELARTVNGNMTPLFCLPEDDDRAVEIVELLLAHGTDPTIRNSEGATAADCARKRGLDDAGELIGSASG
jgi:uncharacterized protein